MITRMNVLEYKEKMRKYKKDEDKCFDSFPYSLKTSTRVTITYVINERKRLLI